MDWLTICADGATTPCVAPNQAVYLLAVVAGIVLLALVVRRSRDFTTATLSLMAVAIAINITIGSLTALLRLPLYLDSVGTVLVGALAGPWAGALTGLLSNLVWSMLPIPGGAGPATAFFAPVAATVGLMAGFWAGRGVFSLRAEDDRIGGFLALAFGIGAAGVALLIAQTTVGLGFDPDDPASQVRFAAVGVAIVAVGGVAAWLSRRTIFRLRGDDPRTRRYLIAATAISAAALVFALLRLLFAPNGYFSTVTGLKADGTPDPFLGGANLTGLALPDPLGLVVVAILAAASSARWPCAWARRGDRARFFPVWVGGFTTGIVAACIAAPIAAGAFGGVTGGGTDLVVALFRTLGLGVLPVRARPGPDERPARQDDQLHGRLRDPHRAADHRTDDVQSRRPDRRGMTRAARGYLVAGTSWLHRRHPLTKLLGVLFVVVAAFLLPAVALVPLGAALLVIAASAGLAAPLLRSFRIPAVLLLSVVVLNALLFPGGRDVLVSLGPLAVTREGLTFGLVSAGRLIVVFIAAMTFLFTTLPDDLLEGLVARGVSHRIAFVVLSAVQLVPRMRERATRSSRPRPPADWPWTDRSERGCAR